MADTVGASELLNDWPSKRSEAHAQIAAHVGHGLCNALCLFTWSRWVSCWWPMHCMHANMVICLLTCLVTACRQGSIEEPGDALQQRLACGRALCTLCVLIMAQPVIILLRDKQRRLQAEELCTWHLAGPA